MDGTWEQSDYRTKSNNRGNIPSSCQKCNDPYGGGTCSAGGMNCRVWKPNSTKTECIREI